jgi:flagellar biosynthesis protein FliP
MRNLAGEWLKVHTTLLKANNMVLLNILLLSYYVITTPITATWYDTSKHPKVHREYSTAAYCDWKYKNKKFIVTNVINGKSDTVVITDKHNNGPTHIDLSKESFGKIAKHSQGKIKVRIKLID